MKFDFVKQLIPMYFGRPYHSVAHVMQCLNELALAKQFLHLEDTEILRAALWFHDAVYDPHSKENEENSALLARKILTEQGEDAVVIKGIEWLILLTKHHEHVPEPNAQLMVDCDLSILGQNEFNYATYEADIRREYDWVPENEFVKKRAAFLEKMLGRPTIYCSEYFIEKYERQARFNITNSIATLKNTEPL